MNNNNKQISAKNTLKKLRTTLAILQGTRLLSTLAREAEATVSHDQTKRVTYLTMLFTRIHRDIFHDWKDQATAAHRPGVIVTASSRKQFRNTIGQLVLDGKKIRILPFSITMALLSIPRILLTASPVFTRKCGQYVLFPTATGLLWIFL